MKNWLITFACISLLLVSLSIAYYFLIILPEQNKARLDVEARKLEQLQQEAEKKEKADSVNQLLLNVCLKQADKDHWDYLKLNGTVTKNEDGTEKVNAPQRIFDYADKVRESDKDTCFKRYTQDN